MRAVGHIDGHAVVPEVLDGDAYGVDPFGMLVGGAQVGLKSGARILAAGVAGRAILLAEVQCGVPRGAARGAIVGEDVLGHVIQHDLRLRVRREVDLDDTRLEAVDTIGVDAAGHAIKAPHVEARAVGGGGRSRGVGLRDGDAGWDECARSFFFQR